MPTEKGVCAMPFVFRAPLLALALSLSLINQVFSQVQSSASPLPVATASTESEVRAVVEQYFALYAAKDLDGLLNLWSAQAPDYATLKQNWQRQFATADFRLSQPAISRFKLAGEKTSLRVTAKLTATDLKSKQQRERQIRRNFALVREDGKWKVWRTAPAENDLAEALMKAKTEAERTQLLTEEQELVTAELVNALGDQAERLANRGNYPQALLGFKLAQSLGEQIGDQAGVSDALNGSGYVHWLQGNYAQALALFQQSLALREKQGDKRGIGRVFGNLGNVHRVQGDYGQALEYYEKSLAIFEAVDDKKQLGIALGNIGVVYVAQGQFARALDYYKKSLALSEATDDQLGVAITLGNIGAVYRKQGNYAQALTHYQKSLALSEAIGDQVGIAQMLNNTGTVYRIQGNYAQALECYQKSLALRESLNDKDGIASALSAIGSILDAQGHHAKAAEYYQKSQALSEAIGDKEGVAKTLIQLGANHQRQGHNAEALDFAERAVARARQIGNPAILWSARASAGAAYRALNQTDQARQAFEEAISISETLRAQVAGSEQEQQRFFEDKLLPYYAMVDLLIGQKQPAEALTFAERARARALLDVLQTGRVNVSKALTNQERDEERKLRAEVNSLNTQVTRLSRKEKPDQARLAELQALREKARLNYEAFQTALYAAHPELRVQRGEAPIIRTTELAALLPDAQSALLEYVVMDDVTYLFSVTKAAGKPAAVRVYSVPVKREDLSKQTEHLRQQLAGRNLGFRAAANELYQLLLKPAQAELRGKTNLIIVPDDKLWELPFQALLAEDNRYLIERSSIAYAPSLTVLREMKAQRSQRQSGTSPYVLLALGNPALGRETFERATLALRDGKLDPLPEAEAEVKALGQLYGAARSKVYVGAEAREDRAKTEAGQMRVLHFATHGVLNNAAPLYSHLVLTQKDASEDGLLEAWELMQLDLKADLAVLSACETARGRYGAGEGMIGLTWALFVAGVPSTVVSQWKVESASTRELMLNFHRVLQTPASAAKDQPTKAEALRQAALKLLKQPETSHPFYWAGFVLVGDSR
jgi:CHAT domain-containing protein